VQKDSPFSEILYVPAPGTHFFFLVIDSIKFSFLYLEM
jgi:hypothetical protein